MPTPSSALDRARADWLAGDASAWQRYRSCLRQLDLTDARAERPRAERPRAERPRAERRPTRPRARA